MATLNETLFFIKQQGEAFGLNSLADDEMMILAQEYFRLIQSGGVEPGQPGQAPPQTALLPGQAPPATPQAAQLPLPGAPPGIPGPQAGLLNQINPGGSPLPGLGRPF